MSRLSVFVVISFALGCIAASTISGCSRAADRTLTIYQLQSMKTHGGSFKIDTSGLPADAINSTDEAGGTGSPVKRIRLNMDYKFEIVLRLAGSE